jgi:NAD(P)-dependent dehydrogenase (short-subunit alcohol dehydrogenase family)
MAQDGTQPLIDVDGLFDLTGRVAIVTGGTRGIGRAVAGGLAAAGARVVVASRKAEACAQVQGELESAGVEALGVAAHMGDIGSLEALVGATVDRFGGIDIVVNNAANALAQPIDQITPEAWDKSLGVNLRGPVFLTQAALPHLEESDHAAVVNVISVGAFMFGQFTSMYASGKGGLLTMTRYMAAEFAERGIRVNALAPGSVDTDMVRGNPPEAVERMAAASKMGRLADPDEMVGPVLFLVSDAASYMTGQVLVVDGALVAY